MSLNEIVKPLNEIVKALGDIGRALAGKDLREPANIEALVDVLLILALIALSIISSMSGWGSTFTMFYMVFAFVFLSIVWCVFHYTVLRIIKKK